MEDTSIDLDIIFIDPTGEVLSVFPMIAHDPNPVEEPEEVAYVLEVNKDSGIKKGDDFDEVDLSEEDSEEDDTLTEEEIEAAKKSRMLVLDENGDVQMKLVGGERIFSRISTRKFIKAAIKAYRSDNDSDYKKVGKLVLDELDALDGRDPEYVEK